MSFHFFRMKLTKQHNGKEPAFLPWEHHEKNDTLIPLSNRVFAAAGEEINRSSKFFEENIRDYEYETIVDIDVEALEYDDIVLINAPFTKEVHNEETLELKTVDFSIPEPLERLDAGHDLILFHNSSDAEFDESMRSILPKLEED